MNNNKAKKSASIKILPENLPPSIDVNFLFGDDKDLAKAAKAIHKACLETGFFYIRNLNSHLTANNELLATMKKFFSLPDNSPLKQSINTTGRRTNNSYGWMPKFQEPAYQPGTLAHVESFDCGRRRKIKENKNFRESRWPEIPQFREIVRKGWDEYTQIGIAVLRAISLNLHQDMNFLVQRCDAQDLSTMRLLHYPPKTKLVSKVKNVGISAHKDFECMTLISQTHPGLELKDINGNWCHAPNGNDQIVVMLGEMLERWTNGFYQATEHRVKNNNWRRYSTVMFFGVNDDVIIEPMNQFITKENPPNYLPIKQRKHINSMLGYAEKNRDELQKLNDLL